MANPIILSWCPQTDLGCCKKPGGPVGIFVCVTYDETAYTDYCLTPDQISGMPNYYNRTYETIFGVPNVLVSENLAGGQLPPNTPMYISRQKTYTYTNYGLTYKNPRLENTVCGQDFVGSTFNSGTAWGGCQTMYSTLYTDERMQIWTVDSSYVT